MKFKIDNKEFEIERLINARRDSEFITSLIESVSISDKLYEVHEPLAEDVITSNDKWSCHISEKHGIIFEFSNDRLCYIALRFNATELRNNPVIHISDEIVNAIVVLERDYTEYAFGSIEILTNEELIPNRWSPIFDSLLIQLSLIN